jgi:hypothetical protein
MKKKITVKELEKRVREIAKTHGWTEEQIVWAVVLCVLFGENVVVEKKLWVK